MSVNHQNKKVLCVNTQKMKLEYNMENYGLLSTDQIQSIVAKRELSEAAERTSLR